MAKKKNTTTVGAGNASAAPKAKPIKKNANAKPIKKNANANGRKFSYELSKDADGYDVLVDVVADETITVISGVEYDIKLNAPNPVRYGISKQIVAVYEGADIEAYYTEYDYTTGEYTENIPVTVDMMEEDNVYTAPTEKERMKVKKNGKPDKDWQKNDYRRNIKLFGNALQIEEMKSPSTFPKYNYKPSPKKKGK